MCGEGMRRHFLRLNTKSVASSPLSIKRVWIHKADANLGSFRVLVYTYTFLFTLVRYILENCCTFQDSNPYSHVTIKMH